MNKFEAEEISKPFHPVLVSCISNAVDRFHSACAPIRPCLRENATAHCINDIIRYELENRSDLGLYSVHQDSGGFFVYRGNLMLRPKLINKNHRSQNHLTKRVVDFKSQQCNLPGLENNMSVCTLGYTLHEVTKELTGVYIIEEGLKFNNWELRIDDMANSTELELVSVPQESCEVTQPRVRIKSASQRGDASKEA